MGERKLPELTGLKSRVSHIVGKNHLHYWNLKLKKPKIKIIAAEDYREQKFANRTSKETMLKDGKR